MDQSGNSPSGGNNENHQAPVRLTNITPHGPRDPVEEWQGHGTIAHVTKASQKKFQSLPPHIHEMLQRASAQLQTQNSIVRKAVDGRTHIATVGEGNSGSAVEKYEWARYQLSLPSPSGNGEYSQSRHIVPLAYIPRHAPQCRFGDQQADLTQRFLIQRDYLKYLAARIPRWEVPRSQLEAKEAFRMKLAQITNRTILKFLREQGIPTRPVPIGLRCIGSFRAGFAIAGSEMELLLSSNTIPEALQEQFPGLLERTFLAAGIGACLVTRIRHGRGPILKVFENPTPKFLEDSDLAVDMQSSSSLQRYGTAHPRFPKSRLGIRCNISFSKNILAMHTTELLRCYRTCDDRVYEMGLFVKQWARSRNINEPNHGTLSSYGYILMLLHYLLNVAEPPVVPNLQNCNVGVRELEWVRGCEVFFWRDESEIAKAAGAKLLTINRESTASLLRGFFAYYAAQGHNARNRDRLAGRFSWVNDVVSIRSHGGLLRKAEKDWCTVNVDDTGTRNYHLLAIEDPFETSHNVGWTVDWRGVWAIRREFQRAHMIINRIQLIPGAGWEWRTDSGDIGEDFFAGPHRTWILPARGEFGDGNAVSGSLYSRGKPYVTSVDQLAVSKPSSQPHVKEDLRNASSTKDFQASGDMSQKREEQRRKVMTYATRATQLILKFLDNMASEKGCTVTSHHTAVDKTPKNQVSDCAANENSSFTSLRTTEVTSAMLMSSREMACCPSLHASQEINDLEIIRADGNGCMIEGTGFEEREGRQDGGNFHEAEI